jgi:hypothetical protein
MILQGYYPGYGGGYGGYGGFGGFGGFGKHIPFFISFEICYKIISLSAFLYPLRQFSAIC